MLGSVGIYGIGAYTVRRRTPEIGVRVALGAAPAEVMLMVLRESVLLVLGGAVAGLAVALAGTRALRAVLFEVSPTDPTVLTGVTVLTGCGGDSREHGTGAARGKDRSGTGAARRVSCRQRNLAAQ